LYPKENKVLVGRAGRSPWRARVFTWSLENLYGDLRKEIKCSF
jgi:hypothetical protein